MRSYVGKRLPREQKIDLLLISGAFSTRTLNSLNSWAPGVQNPEDLHVKHYWEYLATNLGRPDNLHSIKQLLHAVTWDSIRSAYPNITDGHIIANHFLQRCIFLSEKCICNPAYTL